MGDDLVTDQRLDWRATGVRKWGPVLLMLSFVGDGVSPVLWLSSRGPGSLPRPGDVVFLVLAGSGVVAAAVLVVMTLRTRVALEPDGVSVRVSRRQLIPYADIDAAYRDRWSSGAVTLRLPDGRTQVLPAPAAGLRSQNPQLDVVVDLIRQRLSSTAGDR